MSVCVYCWVDRNGRTQAVCEWSSRPIAEGKQTLSIEGYIWQMAAGSSMQSTTSETWRRLSTVLCVGSTRTAWSLSSAFWWPGALVVRTKKVSNVLDHAASRVHKVPMTQKGLMPRKQAAGLLFCLPRSAIVCRRRIAVLGHGWRGNLTCASWWLSRLPRLQCYKVDIGCAYNHTQWININFLRNRRSIISWSSIMSSQEWLMSDQN